MFVVRRQAVRCRIWGKRQQRRWTECGGLFVISQIIYPPRLTVYCDVAATAFESRCIRGPSRRSFVYRMQCVVLEAVAPYVSLFYLTNSDV